MKRQQPLERQSTTAKQLGLFALVCSFTAISLLWVDLPLARAIAGMLSHGKTGVVIHSQYPDLSDLFVIAVTLVSWLAYIILTRFDTYHRLSACLCLIGTAVPFANTAKDLAKMLCGRINARAWLAHPAQYGFHWLNGGAHFNGFPSGHITVVTAFGLAISYYYPRWRRPFVLLLIVLAAALLISEYHFLGDLIAGAYLGYLSYLAARQVPNANDAVALETQEFES